MTPEDIFDEIWQHANWNDVHWQILDDDNKYSALGIYPELPEKWWSKASMYDFSIFQLKGHEITISDYGTLATISIDVDGTPVKLLQTYLPGLTGIKRPRDCDWWQTDEIAIIKLRLCW
jgi:hypothetical protein